MNTLTNWDAVAFFKNLTEHNKLAQQKGFAFARVVGANDFHEIMEGHSKVAFVAVDDISEGYTELNNSPRTRRVKTVYIAMRHPEGDLVRRQACMNTMRELFRQFMSKLILEATKLEEGSLYLDPRIRFVEIPEYFATGYACAKFQVAVDQYTDLRFNEEEWL